MLEYHRDVQTLNVSVRIHKWLCQLPNFGAC
ncbi:hypothetical protein T01_10858 [Trichinella spiralis]|uniref:Uncharacterized protein n=1 Tax=Trichinella spiralis TaxID=6334 RepID=A0A0V1AHQ7_TRISP|nr:hypothetical protein T01_10858 [Trichinella spiralis]